MDRIEKTILKNLVANETYMRQVFPFLKYEYFNSTDLTVFKVISQFITKYDQVPTKEAITLSLQQSNLNETDFNQEIGRAHV